MVLRYGAAGQSPKRQQELGKAVAMHGLCEERGP